MKIIKIAFREEKIIEIIKYIMDVIFGHYRFVWKTIVVLNPSKVRLNSKREAMIHIGPFVGMR